MLVDYLLRATQRDGHSDILRVFLLVLLGIIHLKLLFMSWSRNFERRKKITTLQKFSTNTGIKLPAIIKYTSIYKSSNKEPFTFVE
jgi:hypothetical protein